MNTKTALVRFKESSACCGDPLIFVLPHNREDQDDFSGWQRLYDWLCRRGLFDLQFGGVYQATADDMCLMVWRDRLLSRNIPFSNPLMGGWTYGIFSGSNLPDSDGERLGFIARSSIGGPVVSPLALSFPFPCGLLLQHLAYFPPEEAELC